MLKEIDKYSAEIFKIAGFALMTPFGRVVIQPTVVFNELGAVAFIFYIPLTLFMFLVGSFLLLKGYDILDKEWD
ncbi:MAG: hypothetical protein A3I68_04330 [Candidatus Melainabacteria bacterium RIFCSPLOWO2_02_FULL_35_15]|nr:MAG: hypothetical protein A3F80_06230 [Candidatus Melainabacteria bacterium RIFCSPLOWO2_12_FULL_35_11]OGI14483.1 MAG: hypothetical protein A3I68_04330 [Candidatus Melainabacteria bacterium RIFCSPLOWO2_02_FULL_35_15]